MVNNQIEFNNEFPKEIKEIKIKNKDFQGQLVIKNYPNLEKLYLRDVEKIEKITLKNLDQLQELTIWNCDAKEVVIEDCPQIKKLNVQDNSLTNLEFLKVLDNLEKLELDHNIAVASGLEYLPETLKEFSYEKTELVELLKPYQGDWRVYRKDFQELKEIVTQKPQELLKNIHVLKKEIEFSQKKYNDLKKFLKEILVSLSKDNQEELVNELNNEIETREKNTSSVYSTEITVIKTKELTSSLRLSIEEIKEVKKELETNLTESKKKIKELEKQLVEAKSRAEQRQKKIEGLGDLIVQTPVYEKTIDFLKAKSSFLNARRETIEELQKCYNKWDKFGRRNAVVGEIGSMMSNVGGTASSTIIFGVIPKALGEFVKFGNNFSKISINEKSNKEFQITLTNEEELIQLNNTYDSLIELIQENEETNNILDLTRTRRLRDGKAELFNKKYEVFDILVNDGVWKDRHLSFEKMGEAITSLNQNLKDKLESEWEEQFDKLKLKISRKYGNLILQEQNIKTKIQQLKGHLNELTDSANEKLRSRKLFTEEKNKRNKKRESFLNNLLNVQIEIVRLGDTIERQEKLASLQKELLEISNKHSYKEFKAELDKLCQVQIELNRLELELESLQEFQTQIQISPK